ncbi:MAG: hypothetical protein K6F00_04085, partial [Lachnospiraceae bacterium]|nr:hypothetical protein [Lachnospiraceae bacterium]
MDNFEAHKQLENLKITLKNDDKTSSFNKQIDKNVFETQKQNGQKFLERQNSFTAESFLDEAVIINDATDGEIDKDVEEQAKELTKAQKELIEKEELFNTLREKALTDDSLETHKELIESQIDLVKADFAARRENVKIKSQLLKLDVEEYEEIVRIRTADALSMPLNSPERKKAMEAKEKAEIKLHNKRWEKKISKMVGKEKEHEEEQYQHKRYEGMLKQVISSDDPNCREDAKINVEIGGKNVTLVNVGRAFMGGSKPSYYFLNPENGKRYLYKKAENCCG